MIQIAREASHNPLNASRTDIHLIRERILKKQPQMLFRAAPLKTSLTSVIYVYRPGCRQVVSGAQGALSRST